MYVGYDEDQQALRQELRDYYAELLTPEVQDGLADANGVGPAMRKVVKQMGADGWLGIGWPEEYGGQGQVPARAVHLLRRVDAGRRPGADADHQHGRPDDHAATAPTSRRTFFLPQILGARSTSASATPSPAPAPTWPRCKTRAVRDGDEYVINGQKIFTSLASDADYCWLAVRTEPRRVRSTRASR